MTELKPLPPWTLDCPWCDACIVVNARGMSRNDPGSGVEAAHLMGTHVAAAHDKTWDEFLSTRVVR